MSASIMIMAVRARYGCVWTAAAARSAPFASHVPVDKIQNDAHPFIIDAQVVLQVLNELGANTEFLPAMSAMPR